MPDTITAVRAAVAGRYEIEREIGRGGFATVYLARDLRHDRPVAFKVFTSSADAENGDQRFLREIRVLARLQHPNIVPLIDSGIADGLLYYVMPFIQGESLRAKLERDGHLAADTAISIAQESANALAYAHDQGVIHRDIKPENILLSAGRAMLADFGVARAVGAAGGRTLTRTGAGNPGTPEYMSPEQLLGDAQVDARSDIYSLGCVIYEMLTGRRPFIGGDAMVKRFTESPAPPSTVEKGIPRALDAVVTKALALDPASRYATALELGQALSRVTDSASRHERHADWRGNRRLQVGAAVAAILLTAAAFAILEGHVPNIRRASAGALDPSRVVVAPFVNRTGDRALDPVANMSADWIAQGLAQTGLIHVVPPQTVLRSREAIDSSSSAAGGSAETALANETGAGTVIAGSYYRQNDSLRFEAHIVDAVKREMTNGSVTASAPLADPLVGIEALRGRLMGSLAARFDKNLSPWAGHASQPPNYDSYVEFIQGQEDFVNSRFAESIPHYMRAAQLDSSYTMPLLYAAAAYRNLNNLVTADSILARVGQQRARLAPYDRFVFEWFAAKNSDERVAAIRQAAALAPGSLSEWQLGLDAFTYLNRPREAISVLTAMDPTRGDLRGWILYWDPLCMAYHVLGDHVSELAAADRARTQYPDYIEPLILRGRALAALHRVNEITALADTALRKKSSAERIDFALVLRSTGAELDAHGDPATALRLYDQAQHWMEPQMSDSTGRRRFALRHADLLLIRGDAKSAELDLRQLQRTQPNDLTIAGMLGVAEAMLGKSQDAKAQESWLEHHVRNPADRAPLSEASTALYWRAAIEARGADKEHAVALLSDAIAHGRRYNTTPHLHADPYFAPLRSLQSFKTLVAPKG